MSSEPYDLMPTEADKDFESLTEHDGTGLCARCKTIGAHSYVYVCQCCGKEQSRFETAEYLEYE
jgi:hypothetical protein